MTRRFRAIAPIARFLLRRAAPAHHRDAIAADYDEETAARAATVGDRAAARWAWRQVARSIPPLVAERLRGSASRLRRTHMSLWRGIRGDATLAVRRLLAAPAFTAVAVGTLAIGIGANTAIFTLIDRLLFERLPVPRPTELYRLGDGGDCCVNSGLAGSYSLFSYGLYEHLRDASPEFVQLAAFQAHARTMTIGRRRSDEPDGTINASFVSGNYFQTFQVLPAAGRLTEPADDRPSAAPSAVMSYRAWTEQFDRDPSVIGATLNLNGVPTTIVGVTPPAFYGETIRPDPPDLWVPVSNEPLLQPAARLLRTPAANWLYIVGRLKPGTPLPALNVRLTAALQHWLGATLDLTADERRELPRQHVTVTSAANGVRAFTGAIAPGLAMLQGLVGAVLLIACANLANLLLARGMARRTETAVRVALGAPRLRLVRQALIESVLLACAGGAIGLWIAYAGARAVVSIAMRGTSIPLNPSPSPAVLVFAFAISLATGILFGVAPAVLGSRADPIDALRGAGRTAAERGGRMRRGLVALQIAVSLVLVSCAGLLARSLMNLQTQDFGFERANRVVAAVAPSLQKVPADQLPSLYTRMQERLLRIPGVRNAAFSLYGPMSGDNWSSIITLDGHGPDERIAASWNRASPRYFETIGTPLLRGRTFTQDDGPDAAPVAVVTASFAARYFGGRDPIGKHVGFGTNPANRVNEIVGVVGDAKYHSERESQPMFFLPFLQRRASSSTAADRGGVESDRSQFPAAIVIAMAAPVAGVEQQIRQALTDVDRRITIRNVITLDEQIARQLTPADLLVRMTALFGLIALLLACIGLYGVTAYSVTRRTREIGIRMAIGATRREVLVGVLRSALVQLALGLALGLPAAIGAARLLRTELYGIGFYDPASFGGAVAVLGAAAIVAALIPARRAATMDPVRALRIE